MISPLSSLQSHVKASELPLEKLAANTSLTEDQKVTELSRQFESVLLRQILKDANKTVFTSKYHQDSFAGGIYQDMVTNQLSESISKSGNFGLAHVLNQQMLQQGHSKSTESTTTHQES